MLLPEILLFCLGIFLYVIFAFAHDDFILLRKNISLEHLFNITFIDILVSLFTARVLFIAEHFNPVYFQPLVFFLFPYFPGLSLLGGVIGGYLYLTYSTYRRKMPLPRVSDVFCLAFFISSSLGMVGVYLVDILFTKKLSWMTLINGGIFMIIGIILAIIFSHGKIKDGSTALLGGATFSLTELGIKFAGNFKKISFGVEDILFLIFFFMCVILYFQQEHFSPKFGKK